MALYRSAVGSAWIDVKGIVCKSPWGGPPLLTDSFAELDWSSTTPHVVTLWRNFSSPQDLKIQLHMSNIKGHALFENFDGSPFSLEQTPLGRRLDNNNQQCKNSIVTNEANVECATSKFAEKTGQYHVCATAGFLDTKYEPGYKFPSYGVAGTAKAGTYEGHAGPLSRYDLSGTSFKPSGRSGVLPFSFRMKVPDTSPYPSCANDDGWADMKMYLSLSPAEVAIDCCKDGGAKFGGADCGTSDGASGKPHAHFMVAWLAFLLM